MHKFANFEFDEENWIKVQNDVKKVDFWPNLHKIRGCHGSVKNDGHTTDVSKFWQRMNEQLLNVSAP